MLGDGRSLIRTAKELEAELESEKTKKRTVALPADNTELNEIKAQLKRLMNEKSKVLVCIYMCMYVRMYARFGARDFAS